MNQNFTNLTKGFFVACLMMLTCCVFVAKSYAQQIFNFTTTGETTWTVPAGVTSITIQCWGAGGNGACTEASGGVGGGGGGGGYATRTMDVTAGQVLKITVGVPTPVDVNVSFPAAGGSSKVTNAAGTETFIEAYGGGSAVYGSSSSAAAGGYNSTIEGVTGAEGGSTGGGYSSTTGGRTNYTSGSGGMVGNKAALQALEIPGFTGATTEEIHASEISTTNFNGTAGSKGGSGGSGSLHPLSNTEIVLGGQGGQGLVSIAATYSCEQSAGVIQDGRQWSCSVSDGEYTFSRTLGGPSATPTGGTYSWEKSTDNGAHWTTISGATSLSYTASETGQYRRGYKASEYCPVVYTNTVDISSPADIRLGAVEHISHSASPFKVCPGTEVPLTFSATTSPAQTLVWQQSTDNTNWSELTSASQTITAPLYVRYLINITDACKLTSDVYTIQPAALPVVNSISAPTSLCPADEYTVTATITQGDAAISTYTWTGANPTSDQTKAVVTGSSTECNRTYNYSLKVTDAIGCESAVKNGSFTTAGGSINVLTMQSQAATRSTGENCEYECPDVTEYVKTRITATCSYTLTQSPEEGTPLASNQDVTVTLTNVCGETQTIHVPVTVPAPPTVTLTSNVTGSHVCEGEALTFTATATPSTSVSYNWSSNLTRDANDANKASCTAQVLPSAVAPQSYAVTVTTSYGCTATSSIQLTTLPKAPAPANRRDTICAGSAYSYTPAGSLNTTTYTWTVKENTDVTNNAAAQSTAQSNFNIAGLTNASLAKQTVVYEVTPVTTTTITTDGVSTDYTCTGLPFEITLVVRPSITNTDAVTAIGAKPARLMGDCLYGIPDFERLVESAVAEGVGIKSITQSPVKDTRVEMGSTTTVTVTITDDCDVQKQIEITVNAPAAPTVNLTSDLEGTHTCQGETINFTATANVDPSVSLTGYTWSSNVTPKMTDQTKASTTATPIASAAIPQSYSVTVTTDDGCTATKTLNISVHPKATGIANKTATICPNTAFEYAPEGVPATTTYTWTVESNTDNTNNAAAQTTAQSSFNIASLTNTTLANQTVVYKVTPATTTDIAGESTCTGETFNVTLTVKPSINNEGAVAAIDDQKAVLNGTCRYDIPDLTTLATNAVVNTITVASATQNVEAGTQVALGSTTTVTVTLTDDCNNTKNIDINVIAPAAPTVSLASDLEGTHICEGETINFEATATVDPTVNLTGYTWSENVTQDASEANKASTTAEVILTAAIPQSYSVMVTASDGCTAKDTVKISVHPKAMDIADKTATICPNTAFEYAPEGVPATTTYTWTVTSNTDNTNNATAQLTPKSKFELNGISNTTLANQTVVYEVTPATTTDIAGEYTCTGEPFEVTLTVKPSINNEGAVAAIDDQKAVLNGICRYDIPDLTTLATNAVVNTIKVVSASQTVAAGTEVELGSTTPVTVTLTDSCGNTKNIDINVIAPAAPTVSVVSDVRNNHVCHGDAVNFTATATVSEWPEITLESYTWTDGLTVDADDNSKATRPATTDASALQLVRNTYTVSILASDGCTARDDIEITTLPKADRIADKTDEICMPAGYEYAPANVPTGTTYTWTVKENSDATNNAAAQTAAQTSFNIASLTNTTLAYQTVAYEVTPVTTTVDDGESYACTGEKFDVTLTVKPSITTEGAITDFTNQTVNITLWYGACDTAYFVQTPTYVNHIAEYEGLIALTNNVSETANQGTMFGRMTPGTYTVVWKLTDPCGNYVTYPQNFIVSYPPCGDGLTTTDGDGNEYQTVRVGCECWTKSNIHSTTYTDGSEVAFANVYTNPETPAVDETTFGLLYTWYSAMHVEEGNDNAVPTISTADGSGYKYVQGVCPEGWAIPTVAAYQQATADAAAIMSTDANAWLPGSTATDALGFSAYGAGYYESSSDRYVNLLGESYFWSAEMSSVVNGTCSAITHTCPQGIITEKIKGEGFSVRCVKRSNTVSAIERPW